MEEKKKKKKLTLTTSTKKPHNVSQYTQSRGKTSVVIEKKYPRRWSEKKFKPKDSFIKSKPKSTSDLEPRKTASDKNSHIRKMAEERATRRFKNLNESNVQSKKSAMGRERTFASKREYKLTLSKALDDEAFDGKERSLSSVKRARLKAKKNLEPVKKNIEAKKIIHEVDIPEKIIIQ